MSPDHAPGRPPVDEAIDLVVAGMTCGAPRPDLSRRVVDGIEASRRKSHPPVPRVSLWQLGVVTATMAGVLLAVWTIGVGRRSVPPTGGEGRAAGVQVEGTRSADVTAGPAARAEAGAVVAPPAKSPRVSGARRTPVPAVAAWHRPTMLEPVSVEPLGTIGPPAFTELVPRLEPLVPEAIDVEPLTLEPLTAPLAWTSGDTQTPAPPHR